MDTDECYASQYTLAYQGSIVALKNLELQTGWIGDGSYSGALDGAVASANTSILEWLLTIKAISVDCLVQQAVMNDDCLILDRAYRYSRKHNLSFDLLTVWCWVLTDNKYHMRNWIIDNKAWITNITEKLPLLFSSAMVGGDHSLQWLQSVLRTDIGRDLLDSQSIQLMFLNAKGNPDLYRRTLNWYMCG